ncbi:MAG TPA: YkgJ family cysteine cluster protein [Syntrophales bacterium]|nr:YkgJ family cysteine cluster protein [Syntrophales bacterium]
MEKQGNNKSNTITCKRCGKCCLIAFAPVSDEDMERWRREGKEEILRAMEHSKSLWAGDIVISSENGRILFTCPFLRWEGTYHTCTIYEDRPKVCRNYKPGSSEICSQFKKS